MSLNSSGHRLAWCVLLIALASVLQPVPSSLGEELPWQWYARFTKHSDPGLRALYRSLLDPLAESALGYPVEDLYWEEQGFEMHLVKGVLFLEPPVEGYPVGAYFKGEARVNFTPPTRRARAKLEFRMGSQTLEGLKVSEVYFYTLLGANLADQLGIEEEPDLSFPEACGYQTAKKAMGQLGLELLYGFLNRDGRAGGTSHILMVADDVRVTRSEHAHLLYSFQPTEEDEVSLRVMGHNSITDKTPWKFFFSKVTSFHSAPRVYEPQGVPAEYKIRIDVGIDSIDTHADEEASLTYTPDENTLATSFLLSTRLELKSVKNWSGKELPFIQWRHADDYGNFDQRVVVLTGRPSAPGMPQTLTFVSEGPLFVAVWGAFYGLADEDSWYPRLDQWQPSLFDLELNVPKRFGAVAAGTLVSRKEEGRRLVYHYEIKDPRHGTSFYFGSYQSKEGDAGDTHITAFMERMNTSSGDLSRVVTEAENAVRVYQSILGPLEQKQLRMVGTPTGHGRGFDGLILLSLGGFLSNTVEADLFRAHEIAHQWWGNLVSPKNWPQDRWLMESTAEYSAMEFFKIRYPKGNKAKTLLYRQWIKPLYSAPVQTHGTLLGAKRKDRWTERLALINGGQDVYTRGPMVLNMFRYLIETQKGSDELFWTILQDFNVRYRGQRAGTSEFIALANEILEMDTNWFWKQWLYEPELPTVRWNHTLEPKNGKWLLTVEAEQVDTAYLLIIPIYAHFSGGELARQPLIMKGAKGRRQILLPKKPKSVSLNDNYEALVRVK